MPPTLEEPGLDRLPTEQRLALAEALWASVPPGTDLTDSQREELARRLADSVARPDAVIAWEVVEACALARAQS